MTDTPNRLAGTAFLSINGQSYALVGDFSYRPSTVTRESLSGMDTVHGFKETPIPGQIAATLRDSAGLSVTDFNSMDSVTVTCELANGKVVSGTDLWTIETQEAKAADGTIEVKWEGVSVLEN